MLYVPVHAMIRRKEVSIMNIISRLIRRAAPFALSILLLLAAPSAAEVVSRNPLLTPPVIGEYTKTQVCGKQSQKEPFYRT